MLNRFADSHPNHAPSSADDRRAPTPADVDRFERRAIRAGRWFGAYLVVIGVATAIYLTAIETIFADGLARGLVGGAWMFVVMAAGWWAERRAVYPRGGNRFQVTAAVIALAAYLFLVGPFVRGVYGDELLPWAVGSAVVSLPFFVGAGLVLARR